MHWKRVSFVAVLLVGTGGFAMSPSSEDAVAQFGGPNRTFMYESEGLASLWPDDGPEILWRRPLGDGYSGIAAAEGRLYTMYRPTETQEAVIALEAATSKTVWEFAYEAPFTAEYVLQQGPGPRATPLVVGNRVFAAGATGILHALDRDSGKLLWSHDLIADFGGNVRVRGYSCSPLTYKDSVIMMVGGPDSAVIAFNQRDGSVDWAGGSFQNSYASPLLITVDGQEQVVAFMFAEVVGMDPNDGRVLWSHPHKTDPVPGLNISTPVWGPDNVLFLSSAYGGGSRALRLSQANGRTSVEELWAHNLMRVHFGAIIRVGDHVYGSSGDFGPVPFTGPGSEERRRHVAQP